jgi:hypothetical protein
MLVAVTCAANVKCSTHLVAVMMRKTVSYSRNIEEIKEPQNYCHVVVANKMKW